jgi:hypothetical protein
LVVLAVGVGITGDGTAQELMFVYQATSDGSSAAPNRFGLRDDALEGLDQYDLPQPPPVPDNAFNTYLSMLTPPAVFPNRWLDDVRPSLNLTLDRIELWQMMIVGGATGSPCTITITEEAASPVPYELYLIGSGLADERVPVPGSLTFNLSSPSMLLLWELHLDDQVAVESATWGGVQALYR